MSVQLQQTVNIELRQELALKLEQRMAAVIDLNEQKAAIETALASEREALEALIAETGTNKGQVGEFVFSVSPTAGRMSKADLLAAGVSAAQIAKANAFAKVRAGKDSVRVRRASDKEVVENGD
jgi:hypothetical protein